MTGTIGDLYIDAGGRCDGRADRKFPTATGKISHHRLPDTFNAPPLDSLLAARHRFAAALTAQQPSSPVPYDLVIQGGTLVDGSGARAGRRMSPSGRRGSRPSAI